MTTEIKPCPFPICKREAAGPGEGPTLVADQNDYRHVTCPCGASGPKFDSDSEAVAAWNAAPRLTPAERAVLDAAECVGHLAIVHGRGIVVDRNEATYRMSQLTDAAEALARDSEAVDAWNAAPRQTPAERRGGSDG